MSPLQAARWIPTSGQSSSSWSIMYWSRPTAIKWSEAISSSENKELNLMASHLNVWMVAKVSMILWLSLVTWFIVHIHSYLLSSQGTICSPHRTSISSSSLLSASLSALTLFCQKQIAPPRQRRLRCKKRLLSLNWRMVACAPIETALFCSLKAQVVNKQARLFQSLLLWYFFVLEIHRWILNLKLAKNF